MVVLGIIIMVWFGAGVREGGKGGTDSFMFMDGVMMEP